MLSVLLIGRPGVQRDLVARLLERASAKVIVVDADASAVIAINFRPEPGVIVIVAGPDTLEALLKAVRQRWPTRPICAVLSTEDRSALLRLTSLGLQGLVSMRDYAQALLPILRYFTIGETPLPASPVRPPTRSIRHSDDLSGAGEGH